MLFHKAAALAACPSRLKWKQSGAKNAKSGFVTLSTWKIKAIRVCWIAQQGRPLAGTYSNKRDDHVFCVWLQHNCKIAAVFVAARHVVHGLLVLDVEGVSGV